MTQSPSRPVRTRTRSGLSRATSKPRLLLLLAVAFGALLLVFVVIPILILFGAWLVESSTRDAIVGIALLVAFTIGYFGLIHAMESRDLVFRSR